MANDKFVLERLQMPYTNNTSPIRVSAEAYNLVVDMANESCLPMSKIASQAIKYAYDHLEFKNIKNIEEKECLD